MSRLTLVSHKLCPYVQRAAIVLHEKHVAFERRWVDLANKPDWFRAISPLGKTPVLLVGESPIFESAVICEYLDALAGGGILFPPSGPERWTALTRHALGNGLLDILILWRNERDKPERARLPALLDSFALKTRTALDHLEGDVPDLSATRFGIGHIAIGCCLSYLDFRFADLDWRVGHPALAAWHESFSERPSAQATEIVDA